MKYFFVLSLFFIFNKNSFCQVNTGDKYGGIVKATIASAKSNVNGKWNTADKTGNAAVDAMLNNFVNANKSNPQAIAGLENAASEIKSNPEKYVKRDGAVNKDVLTKLIESKLTGAGNITIPQPDTLDSNTERGNKNIKHK